MSKKAGPPLRHGEAGIPESRLSDKKAAFAISKHRFLGKKGGVGALQAPFGDKKWPPGFSNSALVSQRRFRRSQLPRSRRDKCSMDVLDAVVTP
jgi:hypothetical protein